MNFMSLFSKQQTADNTQEGVIDEILSPGQEWRVRVHGIYWHARTSAKTHFSPGEHIRVVGRSNSKLLIAPL